jgi:hypothetical protein
VAKQLTLITVSIDPVDTYERWHRHKQVQQAKGTGMQHVPSVNSSNIASVVARLGHKLVEVVHPLASKTSYHPVLVINRPTYADLVELFFSRLTERLGPMKSTPFQLPAG